VLSDPPGHDVALPRVVITMSLFFVSSRALKYLHILANEVLNCPGDDLGPPPTGKTQSLKGRNGTVGNASESAVGFPRVLLPVPCVSSREITRQLPLFPFLPDGSWKVQRHGDAACR